jgi:hypothetical protein
MRRSFTFITYIQRGLDIYYEDVLRVASLARVSVKKRHGRNVDPFAAERVSPPFRPQRIATRPYHLSSHHSFYPLARIFLALLDG